MNIGTHITNAYVKVKGQLLEGIVLYCYLVGYKNQTQVNMPKHMCLYHYDILLVKENFYFVLLGYNKFLII